MTEHDLEVVRIADTIYIRSNGRTLGLSPSMAIEIRDALDAVINGLGRWPAETADSVISLEELDL